MIITGKRLDCVTFSSLKVTYINIEIHLFTESSPMFLIRRPASHHHHLHLFPHVQSSVAVLYSCQNSSVSDLHLFPHVQSSVAVLYSCQNSSVSDLHLFPHLQSKHDLGDSLAFLIVTQQLFTILGEMTHADNRVNPIHFGSNVAGIHIWIRINRNRIRFSPCWSLCSCSLIIYFTSTTLTTLSSVMLHTIGVGAGGIGGSVPPLSGLGGIIPPLFPTCL